MAAAVLRCCVQSVCPIGEAGDEELSCGFGADGGTRTRNRPITSRVRYQLRHVGVPL